MTGRLVKSTTLILLVMLVASDLVWRSFQTKVTNQVDESALVKGVQKAVTDKGVNPDVLVVGSSLAYCFTYDIDGAARKTDVAGDPEGGSANCAPSPHFSKATHSSAYVMAMPGAMANDVASVTESMFARGKSPKVVVYTAAPRDFVDNLAVSAKSGYSMAASASASASSAKPTEPDKLKNVVAVALTPAQMRRWDAFVSAPSCAHLVDFAVAFGFQLYEQRTQLKNALVDFVCEKTNHDRDIWSAQHNIRAKSKNKTRFDKDLDNYVARYQPPNFEKFKEQSTSLASLAAVCRKHGAKLVLVNMPVSQENKKLIDVKLYKKYKDLLASVATDDTVVLADSDLISQRFDRSKFLDSAHLNRAGTTEVQDWLAPMVEKEL